MPDCFNRAFTCMGRLRRRHEGNGTVFALRTDGLDFTNLYSFSAVSASYYRGGTNSDGARAFSI